jgi:hypothetical protein
MRVADRRRKELQKTHAGTLAGGDNQRRRIDAAKRGDLGHG